MLKALMRSSSLRQRQKHILERRRNLLEALHRDPLRLQFRARVFEPLPAGLEHNVDRLAEGMDALQAGDALQRFERCRQRRDELGDFIRHPGGKSSGRIVGQDPPLMDESHLLTARGLIHIGRRQEDRDALVVELGQEPPEFLARDWIYAGRRLVEKEDLRRME